MNTKLVFGFLNSLNKNNNKEWFEAYKHQYLAAKEEFENFINEMIPAIRSFDKSIPALTAKECVFRIYRDIRFSADKTPYKTNFGASINNSGKKVHSAGYYIHIQPESSFIAGGIWLPEAETLKAIRKEIYYNIDDFKKIINNKNFRKYFKSFEGDKLSRPPKDFPADFPDIDLLKYKSYIVSYDINEKEFADENAVKNLSNILKEIYPLNEFLNSI